MSTERINGPVLDNTGKDGFDYDSFDRAADAGRPMGFTSIEEIIESNADAEEDMRGQLQDSYGSEEDEQGEGEEQDENSEYEEPEARREKPPLKPGQLKPAKPVQLTDRERAFQQQLTTERKQRQEAEEATKFRVTVPELRSLKAEATNNNFANLDSYVAARQAQTLFADKSKNIEDSYAARIKAINEDPNLPDEGKAMLRGMAEDTRNTLLRTEQNMFQQGVEFHRNNGMMASFRQSASSQVIENASNVLGKLKPGMVAKLQSMPPTEAQEWVDMLAEHINPHVDNEKLKYVASLKDRRDSRRIPEGSPTGQPLPPMNPKAGQGGRQGNMGDDLKRAIRTTWSGLARQQLSDMKKRAVQRRGM
jgi:hypothetical protein